MRLAIVSLAPVVFLSAALAQSGGIPPEWVVQKQLSALNDRIQRIPPVLDQLKPEEWVKKGAPDAYAGQLKSTRAEIGYLIGSSKALMEHPEKLTLALDTLFRMQAVDSMLRSISAGVRRYQNPAVADLLDGLVNGTNADREQLRQYIVELAADREEQFRVVDREAQRCRAGLSRQPREKEVRR